MQSRQDGVYWIMYMAHLELYIWGSHVLELVSVEVLKLIPYRYLLGAIIFQLEKNDAILCYSLKKPVIGHESDAAACDVPTSQRYISTGVHNA